MDSLVIKGRLFSPEEADPETISLNERIIEQMSSVPPLHTLSPDIIRAAREQGMSVWGPFKVLDEVEEREIPGPAGPVAIRVHIPEKVSGVYLHFHGGGFVLGRAHHFDEPMAALSKAANLVVVSVDYRLAPENPYPAGPDDCEAAALWLIENAAGEFGTEKLVIGGESAGANLTASVLVRLRERHGFTGFRAANFLYGVFDLGHTPSVRSWGDKPLVLTTSMMTWFNQHYAGGKDLRNPDISPLYSELHDLPPALFTVGTQDPLLDDTLFMASRWLSAGNKAHLDIVPGGCHGFNAFPIPAAEKSGDVIVNFLNECLA